MRVIAISCVFTGWWSRFSTKTHLLSSVGPLGSATGLALTREVTPAFAVLMLIARVDSSMAAELEIMRAEHQFDAFEYVVIDPYRMLIVPKLGAILMASPILVALFVVVGTFGGYTVSVLGLPDGGIRGRLVTGSRDRRYRAVNKPRGTAREVRVRKQPSMIFGLAHQSALS